MVILAIDLGKAKSLFCWYQTEDQSHEFKPVPSTPQASTTRWPGGRWTGW